MRCVSNEVIIRILPDPAFGPGIESVSRQTSPAGGRGCLRQGQKSEAATSCEQEVINTNDDADDDVHAREAREEAQITYMTRYTFLSNMFKV